MANEKLKIDVRRSKILEILNRDGQVRVTELSKWLNTTPVTIRSDLDSLERDGFLERVSGGAVQTVKNYYNLDFLQRKQANSVVKKRLAAAVSDMIHDGDTLLINSGTTTYFVAVELKKHKNLNIVTNSLSVAVELGAHPTFRVILLGGDINAQYAFTYGSDAQEQLGKYRADYAILSMDGVCPESGLTTYHAEEAVMDRLMMRRAKRTIVAAESRKLGKEGFSHVCGAECVSCLVTDGAADRTLTSKLRTLGVELKYGG